MPLNLIDRAILCEVGPRDGLQNEKRIFSVEEKLELIQRSADAGFPVIEVSHYDSEIMCCEALSDMIKSEFRDLKVVKAPNSRPYKTLEEL